MLCDRSHRDEKITPELIIKRTQAAEPCKEKFLIIHVQNKVIVRQPICKRESFFVISFTKSVSLNLLLLIFFTSIQDY